MKPKVETVLTYNEFSRQLSREGTRHNRAVQRLYDALEAFQKLCKHQNTRFQGDPAGGHDSHYICILCSKVL